LTDLEIAGNFRKAADYLRANGHFKHGYSDPSGSAKCLSGVLAYVCESENVLYADYLGYGAYAALGFDRSGDLFDWNDADERTLGEVLDLLESTALGLEVRALAADKPAEELVAVGV
jgi:hypothetical protein